MKILCFVYLISWLILLLVYLYDRIVVKTRSKDNDSWVMNVVLIVFAPLVVVAMPFILLSDAKKKKTKLSSGEKKILDEMTGKMFGGASAFKAQVLDLHSLLDKRYEPKQIANALTWMTLQFSKEGDKSEYGLVDEGQMRRLTNPFSKADAVKIYRYVAKKSFQKSFPNATEEMFEAMFANLGNGKEGCKTDVIPGAYGEFGYDLTNPIPTRGIPSNETYLRRLRLLSGEKFKWERIGSYSTPNIKNPIDGYEIRTENGELLCTIFISPYQRVISNQAPKGFYLA